MKLIINIDEDRYDKNYLLVKNGMGDDVHRAVANGTPIPDNATVCDIEQIKAEIDKQAWSIAISDTDRANGMWDAYRIIDKYMKGA